jgi:hypothetical protein
MIEQVKYDDLVEGQQYFVIHKRGALVEGDLIYVGRHYFKYPNSRAIFQIVDMYHFYRYVSKYEYYMALKQKYDDKCLNIVLKRLVNENFEW